MPLISVTQAQHILACLRRHEDVIGIRVVDDVDLADPLVTSGGVSADGARDTLVHLNLRLAF
ncbi:hypothetical protein ADM96_26450 [Burkholderia sp. ST111]|nr:hypothetical protein ADM96_26450 [Burkholderia sp. ST111]